MEQYINKAAVVAEINRVLNSYDPNEITSGRYALMNLHDFLDTLEVKKVDIPALDNGNMPIERWKEACQAASCQANYRKSKGLTENHDDYFVDGVQWADEHPKKVKEVDINKEISQFIDANFEKATIGHKLSLRRVAKHFFELGLKAQKGE